MGSYREMGVRRIATAAVTAANAAEMKIGLYGKLPSNAPEFAIFPVRERIDSIALNPDSVIRTVRYIAAAETSPSAMP